MNLKNYTSEVPVERSIAYIEKRLIDGGAYNINKEIDREKKTTIGIIFQIDVRIADRMQPMVIKLPAKVEQCYKRLWAEVKKPIDGTEKRVREQAGRTAWKLLWDWVDVQMSLIDLDQVEFTEVFLPYLYNYKEGKTFFERIKSNNFKNLQLNETN